MPKVLVWATVPGEEPFGAGSPTIRGYLLSRIQTGRFGLASVGLSIRIENEPSAPSSSSPAAVKIVTARFGITSSPVFSTSSSRSVVSARRWRFGNFDVTTSVGKSPVGSESS